eukprot:GHUV01013760.1.p1 GENE.GHUV01013760.1~~GHUV01013760.1.p1  ORF type:complete len:293 (+),score=28.40 GHUV01013760.1:101-979(+)
MLDSHDTLYCQHSYCCTCVTHDFACQPLNCACSQSRVLPDRSLHLTTHAMSNTVTETRVTFQSPEGQHLAGILTEPVQSASSTTSDSDDYTKPLSTRHCAILCHGFASHKNGFHFAAIAAHLANNLGLSSLRFDYAGNMDSSGDFRFGGFMKEVEQMAAAKAFLEQQHSKQVVLLLGHSRGAINATLYSVKYGDIPMVVLLAGRYDLKLNMTQRYGPDVLQQLQQSGPWKQVSKRDGDKFEIHWTLTAEEPLIPDVLRAFATMGSPKTFTLGNKCPEEMVTGLSYIGLSLQR